MLQYDLVVSHTKRPEALKRSLSACSVLFPRHMMTLSSTVGLTVSSSLGLLVYLSSVSVFVTTFSTRAGVQFTFCLFYPTTTAMHQPGFQLHPSQSSFPETLYRMLFSLGCSEEKQESVRTFSVSTGSPKWVPLSQPLSSSVLSFWSCLLLPESCLE